METIETEAIKIGEPLNGDQATPLAATESKIEETVPAADQAIDQTNDED